MRNLVSIKTKNLFLLLPLTRPTIQHIQTSSSDVQENMTDRVCSEIDLDLSRESAFKSLTVHSRLTIRRDARARVLFLYNGTNEPINPTMKTRRKTQLHNPPNTYKLHYTITINYKPRKKITFIAMK